MPLTVGKLKEVIKDLPDEMSVGVRGWFGEFNEFSFAPTVKEEVEHGYEPGRKSQVLLFDHVDIGEEPD